MANTYQWYSTPYECAADPSKSHGVGWYMDGKLLASTYRNPSTGLAYTPQELQALAGGGGVVTGDTGGSTIPTTSQLEAGGNITPAGGVSSNYPAQNISGLHAGISSEGGLTTSTPYSAETVQQMMNAGTFPSGGILWGQTGAPSIEQLLSGQYPQAGGGLQAGGSPSTSTLENLQVPQAPTLPPYKPTAELEKLSSQVGGAISGIIEQGGMGIGEETKQQIFQREAEIINASTAQANKNLEDKMAAQGLSNSGMAFSEGMKLASKSTIAMANVMRDVEIQDSLMKVASYQNALGLGVQFLSYLSEESWRQYQPTLYQWQAQVDMYKLAIQDAYNKQDMALAHQYDMQLAQFTASTNIQLTQMQIDAAAKAANKAAFWDILGTGLGLLAALFI